jgi:hypothetical protein
VGWVGIDVGEVLWEGCGVGRLEMGHCSGLLVGGAFCGVYLTALPGSAAFLWCLASIPEVAGHGDVSSYWWAVALGAATAAFAADFCAPDEVGFGPLDDSVAVCAAEGAWFQFWFGHGRCCVVAMRASMCSVRSLG